MRGKTLALLEILTSMHSEARENFLQFAGYGELDGVGKYMLGCIGGTVGLQRYESTDWGRLLIHSGSSC